MNEESSKWRIWDLRGVKIRHGKDVFGIFGVSNWRLPLPTLLKKHGLRGKQLGAVVLRFIFKAENKRSQTKESYIKLLEPDRLAPNEQGCSKGT